MTVTPADDARRLRACVVDLPVLIADIVRATLTDAGAEIVPGPADLVAGLTGRHANVVITGRSYGRGLASFDELLLAAPATAILSIAESGRGATLWELWPNERTLGELSGPLLVSALTSITPFEARLAAAAARSV